MKIKIKLILKFRFTLLFVRVSTTKTYWNLNERLLLLFYVIHFWGSV